MASKTAKILLVEDDPSLQILTSAILRDEFVVVPVSTAAEAQSSLISENFDLVLLDLGLPDEDGLVVARQIRSRSSLPPIIFLTSREATLDKVEALNAGGDDYVTKPFDPDELKSRIGAVLRRTMASDGMKPEPTRVRVGYVEIDLASRQVWTACGDLAPLTRAEFDVLLALVDGNGRVLSRQVLLDAISSSPEHDASDRTVDAIISRIRRKLVDNSSDERIIVTVHGIGYRLGVVRS